MTSGFLIVDGVDHPLLVLLTSRQEMYLNHVPTLHLSSVTKLSIVSSNVSARLYRSVGFNRAHVDAPIESGLAIDVQEEVVALIEACVSPRAG